MVQGGLKKVQGGLKPPLAPHFPRLCAGVQESQGTQGAQGSRGTKGPQVSQGTQGPLVAQFSYYRY